MTTGILTLIILAVILAQIVIFAVIGLYRRRRQYQVLPKRVPPVVDRSVIPDLAWEGFREFKIQRRVFEDTNQSICSFYLVPTDGKPLPTFKPGQFLTFKLSIKRQLTPKPKSVVRCYSLSDRPRPDYYRITIKRVLAPPDQPNAPPGLSSNYFHDHLQEGSRLMVKAPSGHFHLMEEQPLPIVLIAGGIGITPMLSILNTVLESGIAREVWLYYGVRNGNEQIMKEHLLTFADRQTNFHLHICYSDPNKGDIEKTAYQHKGRVTIQLLRSTLKLMRYQFYVCGPKSMMESIVPGLEEWGVDTNDIYYESFGPATLIKHEKPAVKVIDEAPMMVSFKKLGKSIRWDPTADSLLEFAEANGIEVDSGCRAGACGTCQTTIISGQVEYNQQPDADIEQDSCLLCISKPKGDLTLDA